MKFLVFRHTVAKRATTIRQTSAGVFIRTLNSQIFSSTSLQVFLTILPSSFHALHLQAYSTKANQSQCTDTHFPQHWQNLGTTTRPMGDMQKIKNGSLGKKTGNLKVSERKCDKSLRANNPLLWFSNFFFQLFFFLICRVVSSKSILHGGRMQLSVKSAHLACTRSQFQSQYLHYLKKIKKYLTQKLFVCLCVRLNHYEIADTNFWQL